MRVPWKRLTWILAAALPVAAVAGIIWVGTRDLSRFQSRMTEQVRKVTGRELAARVPLTIKLGTQPAMVAEGVTLTNASWGSRPELARVRKLTLFLDPASLFLGEVKIGRVLLEGADILVERNEVGDTNLDMLPPPDGSGPHPGENRSLRLRTSPAFPWINTIEVRDSVLTIAEGQGRPPVVLEIAGRDLQVAGAQPAAAARGQVRGAAGHAARAHRHGRLVRRLDARAARQHRCAGRLRRRQDRDQGQRRRQGHQPGRSRRRVRTSRCSAPTYACRCRPADPMRSTPRPAPCAAPSRSSSRR